MASPPAPPGLPQATDGLRKVKEVGKTVIEKFRDLYMRYMLYAHSMRYLMHMQPQLQCVTCKFNAHLA